MEGTGSSLTIEILLKYTNIGNNNCKRIDFDVRDKVNPENVSSLL